MSGPFTLPVRFRLRTKRDFDRVYAQGLRFGDGCFGLVVAPNMMGHPRLGLAVAVRVAGNGVRRNRLRRIVRESFRLHRHALPAADVIVSARPKARDVQAAALHASLAALWSHAQWQKVSPPCVTPPPR